MGTSIAVIAGIVLGIFVIGLKTGIGCGFSSIDKKQILLIASSYLALSFLIGILLAFIDISVLTEILGLGVTLHAIIALFLIGAGIYTQKKWLCGHDVSRKTFLFLAVPCPACLSALILSCIVLATTVTWSGWIIGTFVGAVFFISILSSSWLFGKMNRTPEDLGTVMMFLGLFYLLGAMLIPAYMQSKQLNITASGGEFQLAPLLIIAAIVLSSYAINKLKGD
ncbi:membrane transporter [Methanosalsum zhilinae DSM 4017]|uniref:Membrane transporter n=1 Tax=Methanosalsum zhilinae (strain DSM 4017 / NBRC 107636 / OCM 62 / WeN5) TaxID=679901 RepID=F7XLK0_METZD|nr:DUF2162 domain-containing protein [Methanosalsum zhilinae]AEH60819.1 membrane transporter [Methanosalsum zhilinae DSM 4017]